MPFTELGLHPSLLQGLKDLGFSRPTPIQADAIPLAMAGQDLLACAMTGSGKTAAFLLPILHGLIGKPRGTTRALVLTPTRELAAQIVEDLNDLAVHTPLTAAAVYRRCRHGAAGARLPQRRRRHRRDAGPSARSFPVAVRQARPACSFWCSTKRIACSTWASCPTSAGCSSTFRRRQAADAVLQRDDAAADRPAVERDAEIAGDDQHRAALSAGVGITHAVYPVPQDLKPALLLHLLKGGDMHDALVFTRTKHRANRLANSSAMPASRSSAFTATARSRSGPKRSPASRAASTACWWRPTSPRAASTSTALGHVVNFDVPHVADDYIHRVGRTARAETTGEAFTFVSPEEEGGPAQHREGDRDAAPARDAAGLRLHRAPAAEPRSPAAASGARAPGPPPAPREA